MFCFILIFTLLYCIFIEVYVGSIALRRNAENIITLNISSMLNYLVNPLHSSFLWNPSIVHCNYPFMLVVAILINLIFT